MAGVRAADKDKTFHEGWTGSDPASEQFNTLDAVAKQRTAEANGAELMYVPYVRTK